LAEEQPLPPVPTFTPGEKVCGNCKLWSAISVDAAKGWVGQCRVQPSRGLFVPSAPICDAFAARGGVTVPKPAPEPERVKRIKNIAPVVVRRREDGTAALPVKAQVVSARGDEQVDFGDVEQGDSEVQMSAPFPPGSDPQAAVPVQKKGVTMTRAELMDIFLEATGQAEVSLAPKWEGGVVQMVPKDGQAKEIPIDSLFHKVVMVRDRLRTLEMKLNAHPKLSDAEKVEMQQYVTRCYGSLTTFNVLFREKGDQFIGQKGEE
jgi:hypothetical protein